MRVLVADDAPGMVAALERALAHEGFEVVGVHDGETALARARRERFDLLILNVMMPKLFGTDVCRILRAESEVPIILLSARDAVRDRVRGLELGADDYVTKPFALAELFSRVRAVLRRRARPIEGRETTWKLGGLEFDLERCLLRVNGAIVPLTLTEFRLIALLARRSGQVVSRSEIMKHLWGSEVAGSGRPCDTYVSNLRRKLARFPGLSARIVTVRRAGYRLDPE